MTHVLFYGVSSREQMPDTGEVDHKKLAAAEFVVKIDRNNNFSILKSRYTRQLDINNNDIVNSLNFIRAAKEKIYKRLKDDSSYKLSADDIRLIGDVITEIEDLIKLK